MNARSPEEQLDAWIACRAAAATSSQMLAVRDWQRRDGRFYNEVQKAARGATATPVGDRAMTIAGDLQELTLPLPVDVVVWRGVRNVRAAFGKPGRQLNSLADAWKQMKGFTATSLSRRVAESEFTKPGIDPALFRIIAREGTPALWVPPFGRPEEAYQLELLFPPGIAMRVLDVLAGYNPPIAEAEVRHGQVER